MSDREAEYQARARTLDSTMQTRQADLVRPIMEQVQKVIETIRAEDGYSMILDVGSLIDHFGGRARETRAHAVN